MAEMTVILRGWLTQMRKTYVYDLSSTASPRRLILNKFRIYKIWHIRWRKPRQLALLDIKYSNLRHSMTTNVAK